MDGRRRLCGARIALLGLLASILGAACAEPVSRPDDARPPRIADTVRDTVITNPAAGGGDGRPPDPRADIVALEARVESATLVVTVSLAGDPTVWPAARSDVVGYQVLVRPDDPDSRYDLTVDYDSGAWRLCMAGPNLDNSCARDGLELGQNSVTMRLPLVEITFPRAVRLMAFSYVCKESGEICENDQVPNEMEDDGLFVPIRE